MRNRIFTSALLALALSCQWNTTKESLPTEKMQPVAGQAGAPKELALEPAPEEVAKGPNGEAVPIGTSPVHGASDALVTIVIFSDMECPFCGVGNEAVQQIFAKYGDSVRMVWKNLPLPMHRNAGPAAIALMAVAEQSHDLFWKAQNAMFQRQQEYVGRAAGMMTPKDFEKFLTNIQGIDLARWRKDIDDERFTKVIMQDMRLAEQVGVQATPSFLVNGKLLEGAPPVEQFFATIDAEQKEAQSLVDSGTARDKVYAERLKKNLVTADTRFFVEATGPSYGPKDAKITIVVFTDYECPYCKRGEENLRELLQKYPNDIRVFVKNLPLTEIHPNAFAAAQASLVANEQGKFLEFQKKLYENQRIFDPQNPDRPVSGLGPDKIEKYAAEVGLDVNKLKEALASKRFAPMVEADMQVAAALDLSGTPAFYINGKALKGAYPVDAMEAVVKKDLQVVSEMLSKGVAPADIYNTLMKDAYKK